MTGRGSAMAMWSPSTSRPSRTFPWLDALTGAAAETRFFERDDGVRLAYALSPGESLTAVYFCGMSTPLWDPKALAMEALCRRRGYASLRFDYQGRSGSSGDYDDGTLGTRLDDALSVIDEFTEGPLVLVGYSMGGWLAFLAALRRTERLAGLMGIAPGIDFVDWINDKLSSEENVALHRDGRVVRTSPDYPGETWITTLALIEDAENHRLLTGPIEIDCPVRLIHGLADPDAPWEVSPRTAEQLTSADVEVILLKDAGHILRSDREVERFMDVFGELLDAVAQ